MAFLWASLVTFLLAAAPLVSSQCIDENGATVEFPCYKWLSVTEDEAKVEREISLEIPTTFWQVSTTSL